MGIIMDLKNIMQHGLIIFRDNSGVTVKKISTPTSPTEVLHNEVGPDCSTKNFPLYDLALTFCESFVEHGLEEANLTEATVSVGYNPTGHALKTKTLDNVKAATYDEAVELAKQQALAFFEAQGIAEKIGDNFEVQVRPISA